jgi:hypothetical protein
MTRCYKYYKTEAVGFEKAKDYKITFLFWLLYGNIITVYLALYYGL